jgi:hypothetical protein
MKLTAADSHVPHHRSSLVLLNSFLAALNARQYLSGREGQVITPPYSSFSSAGIRDRLRARKARVSVSQSAEHLLTTLPCGHNQAEQTPDLEISIGMDVFSETHDSSHHDNQSKVRLYA